MARFHSSKGFNRSSNSARRSWRSRRRRRRIPPRCLAPCWRPGSGIGSTGLNRGRSRGMFPRPLLTRRRLFQALAPVGVGTLLAACQSGQLPPTPRSMAVPASPVASLATRMNPTPTAQPTVAAREPQEAKMTPASTSLTNDNFARVRARWRSLLTLGPSPRPSDPDVIAGLERQAATARRFWSSLQTSADRAFLWPDLANPSEPGQVAESYNRLRVLALAYATPGSSLQNAPKLKADLLGALDWLSANGYNEQKTKVGNWWYWEIGIPLALNDIVILLNEALSADQISQFMGAIDHFTPVVKYTGANLVWLATIIAIRAAIVESDQKLVAARDGLSPVFRYVTSGDGFYADGSFIQHEAHP